MKIWIELFRAWGSSSTEDFDPYPRRWFTIIKCMNGRRIMISRGHHKKAHAKAFARKLADYTGIELRID